jgi:hypothetical protein
MLKTNLVIFLLILTGVGFSHGIDEHRYEAEGRDTSIVIENQIPGANLFAQQLAIHSQYLFSSEQLDLLHTANAHFILYGKTKENPADKQLSPRHYTLGQQYLSKLLACYENHIVYDFSSGDLKSKEVPLVEMPMELGSVIIKVVTGNAASTAYQHKKIELETYTEHLPPVEIMVQENAVNWIHASFWNVPNQTTSFFLNFKAGQTVYPVSLKVQSPQMGEFEIEILGDDGRPCPAMIRMMSKRTQSLYRPANALIFDAHMDDIAGYPAPDYDTYPTKSGRPYGASMPDPYGGHYWYVLKGFDMAMPTGQWQIVLMKGFEHTPIIDTITVESGKKIKKTFQLKRWTNMSQKGWYSGDDHIHSRLMSSSDEDNLLTILEAADIKVGNILMMGNPYRTVFEQRGYGKDYRVQRGDYHLVPGMEDPRYFYGHAIGLNLAKMVREDDKLLLNTWIADQIHKDGGLYGHAHVLFNIFNIIRDIAILMPQGKSDFGEIMQSGLLDTELYYDFLDLGYKFTASTGTDMPFGHAVGESAMYAYAGKDDFEVHKWFDAVKAGHTFVTNGPLVEFTVDNAIPGDQINVDKPKKLRVRVKATGIAGTSAPKEIQIVRFAEVIKSVKSDDPQQTELNLGCSVDSDDGFWIAAKVISYNGAQAHTTPIYVVRDGYRFWNVERAQQVINRCYGVLDEMEYELKHIINQHEKDQFPQSNLYGPMTAKMAPQAIKKIQQVRIMYEGLERDLIEERKRRL